LCDGEGEFSKLLTTKHLGIYPGNQISLSLKDVLKLACTACSNVEFQKDSRRGSPLCGWKGGLREVERVGNVRGKRKRKGRAEKVKVKSNDHFLSAVCATVCTSRAPALTARKPRVVVCATGSTS